MANVGAGIGHGGIVVFDDTVDLAEQAHYAFEFCEVESCGKCTPCRLGAVRGKETMQTILDGRGGVQELTMIRDLCEVMESASLCQMGGMTPIPVLRRHGAVSGGLQAMTVAIADFGTPAPVANGHAADAVELTIDGHPLTVPAGTSIMRAARSSGLDIPKLCATDNLKAFGSCRMCLVEVEGRRGLLASCTEPVAQGMVVRTQTEKVARVRRGVMELYISDHPLDCLTCAANGDCELQDMAGAVGLREVRYADGDNHLGQAKDETNPYFTFDPSKCIACSRCVRACSEVQGTFALTIDGRGFESKVATGADDFLASECVSCGACVQACPTATLMEKSVIDHGVPDRSESTTCAYCGVGCSFRAEMKGDQVVRMVPHKDGKANHGHSCVKGRFAWGYANHKDRITKPMVRESTADPWREVTWDEAIEFAASRLQAVQSKHGRKSIGGITSSRCTNEEVWLVQKMVRAAFGNNNVDTCARVCHSPTGYGLRQTYGTSAGTQDFDSVQDADVIVVIGANPTEAHPVFASQMKRRLRAGARLVVCDPRRIDLVRSPHVEAEHHLALQPGTNVPLMNAFAHVVVTEGLVDRAFVEERCDIESFEEWADFARREENAPEQVAQVLGVDAEGLRAAARLYATGGNSAIYYGLGVTEHSQGSTMVMAMANLAMATGNVGRRGVGVNPLRGQNNVQGSCDMGSFPHEFSDYRPVTDDTVRAMFNRHWDVELDGEAGFRIPNMLDHAVAGDFRGLYVQGEDIAQSDPNTQHVEAALANMECLIVQDLFLNETAKFAHVFPAGRFVPREGRHLRQRRAPHQPGAGADAAEGRRPRVGGDAKAGDGVGLSHVLFVRGGDSDRDRRADAELCRSFLRSVGRSGQRAMALQRVRAPRHADHARTGVRARQGAVRAHGLPADAGARQSQVPALAHHRAHPHAVQRRRPNEAHGQPRLAR